MRLLVKVLKAANLAAKDPNGRSDPYCRVYLGAADHILHRTEVKMGTLNPEWKETFTLFDGELAPFLHTQDGMEYQISGYLIVDVWDHDTMNPDDFLGIAMIPLRDVPTLSPQEEWYPLTRRSVKEKVSGSILLELQLKVDKNKFVDKTGMNSDLYQRCKLRGYHLPVLSGKDVVELPGRTERVEMAFSNVFVDISSNHCVAQVFLTNYRLVILSNRHPAKGGHNHTSSVDLSTWIALNNIMSIDVGHETIVVRKNQKKQKTTSITIHCYDIRLIKLIFVREEDKKRPMITAAPEMPRFADRLNTATSANNRSFGFKLRNISSPALGKRLLQTFTDKGKSSRGGGGGGVGGGAMWHVDFTATDYDEEQLKRTRSDAVCSDGPRAQARKKSEEDFQRPRSKSGDSSTLSKLLTIATAEGASRHDSGGGPTEPAQTNGHYQPHNGHTDMADMHKQLKIEGSLCIVKSRSTEDISLTGSINRNSHVRAVSPGRLSASGEPDFCELNYSEPEYLDTGGGYTMIFDECEDMYLSDDDVEDQSVEEVKDLTPFDTPAMMANGGEGARKGTGTMTPPRATSVLIHVFRQRLESVMINGVDYPPGLFFVQLYEGYLQLTGWDLYQFPKEMDRQTVCEEKWRLSVQNGPEYRLCSTYPQLMYVPRGVQDTVVLESSNFRSKNRFPCLVWVDSKRENFMLRCSQPLAGKSGKHSLEDEQLIEACLNAGPPEGELMIFDARSSVAATGNMLKGKGTENVTHYPRAKLTYLDIPNIHAVRESYEALRTLCLSGESSKWYSALESTQWLSNLSLIIKGAVMIARYMKLQRGNSLVHCSDGWDRTAQLTSLAQVIMDPYYRTYTGFMVLIEKEWLAFGHKFQHRLGHPDYPNERSPVFLQFLDCIHQMLRMFPKAFEFNSFLLLRVADHLHTGWFGTFLCNCDKERHDISLYARSPSLWAHLQADKEPLLNQDFSPNKQPIFPTSNLRHIKLWEEYFLRHDSTSLTSHGWRREVDPRDRQTTLAVQRTTSVFSDHLQESWATDHVIWMADDKANECLLCHTKFTPFKRRHHCRACGHIFCDECSKNKIALSHLGYSRPERVCVECYSKLNAAQKTSDTDDGFLLISCNTD